MRLSRKVDAPARPAAATRGCARRWSLARSLSRWCCSSLPVCCCGVLRRCAPSISASARTISLPPPTRCRRNSMQRRQPWMNSIDELIRRLQQLPGVKSVGLTSFLPASGNNSNSAFVAEGYVPPQGADMNLATAVTVQGDYLQAMGIPLLARSLLHAGGHGEHATGCDRQPQARRALLARFGSHWEAPAHRHAGDADALGDHCRGSRRREGGLARRSHQGTVLSAGRTV